MRNKNKKKMHQNKNQNKNESHQPVLLTAVLKYLDPQEGDSYLDLTAGYGGHARAVLDRTGKTARTVLVDRDESAIKILRDEFPGENVDIRRQDFLSATRGLIAENSSSILFWQIWAYRHRTLTRASAASPSIGPARSTCGWTGRRS